MRWWGWWRRPEPVKDPTGPATRYGSHTGAYAPDYRPSWNQPTEPLPQTTTLLTPGQKHRARGAG